MSYNPAKGIGFFEQGSIMCACCGWKPEDGWDDHPEGFTYVHYDTSGQWECDDCFSKNNTIDSEQSPRSGATKEVDVELGVKA